MRCSQALIDSEKMGLYELHASTQAAIAAALGFTIKSKKKSSRARTIENHHKAFRYVWGLAEKFYASSLSTVVFSTIGNAIVSPAFEHVNPDTIIIDEATNIAEPPAPPWGWCCAYFEGGVAWKIEETKKKLRSGDIQSKLAPYMLIPTPITKRGFLPASNSALGHRKALERVRRFQGTETSKV